MTPDAIVSAEYRGFLESIKERVRTAQTRAALAVNHELVLLYWSIGRDILDRQAKEGGGERHRPPLAGSSAGVSGHEGLLAP